MNTINTRTNRSFWQWPTTLALVLACLVTTARSAEEELAERASWSEPNAEAVKAQLDEWLTERKIDPAIRGEIEKVWMVQSDPPRGLGLLERVAGSVALADERAQQLVATCLGEPASMPLPEFEILDDEEAPPLVRNNLRLMLARWLAQHRLYDESLEHIADLKPEDVVDPASLLFYQSAAQHWLMSKEECLASVAKLLERRESIPRRYETMAELMKADLEPLKTDSLDEISRLMKDIHRRLHLARAGKKVRKQEDDVVAKLDKMIEELEKQRQQQQQQGAGGGNNPSQPMPDSQPGGGTGPGNVDPKKMGSRADWGNLPPKERQEALQQIGQDFPSHYREVIEEYFRKLARDGASE